MNVINKLNAEGMLWVMREKERLLMKKMRLARDVEAMTADVVRLQKAGQVSLANKAFERLIDFLEDEFMPTARAVRTANYLLQEGKLWH
ncbi:hypothetical protein A4G18_07330 [Pasteurellaceae bacterium Pebbles2]|nr:hypothetical protein [Pasteurellaceae bacterium Pebbles2]